MKLCKLGKTNLKVSEVGLGTWPLGGPAQVGKEAIGRGHITESQAITTIRTACESEINFFDTADIYGLGRSEEILGKAFNGKWEDNIVATKIGKVVGKDGELATNYSPSHICKAVEGSLKRLRKDTIDLLQLHNPTPSIVQEEKIVECLEKLKSEGKIRYWGISARLVNQAVQMVKNRFLGSSLQVVFNLLRQEAAYTLFPIIRDVGIGIIVRVPLEYGVLTNKFTKDTTFPKNDHRHQNLEPMLSKEIDRLKALCCLCDFNDNNMAVTAIRFCLSFPEVTSVIPGARNPEQVVQNASASQFSSLSLETIAQIRKFYFNDFKSDNVESKTLDNKQ